MQQIDTYAVRDNVGGSLPGNIDDATDTTNPALYNVYTNKVEQEEDVEGQNLETTVVTTLKQIDGTTDMSLEPNTITKVRCYIWLEGQDIDCNNIASTGQELRVTLRLVKPQTQGTGTDNTYSD